MYVALTHKNDQAYPSPAKMFPYEHLDETDYRQYLAEFQHEAWPETVPFVPAFTGDSVKSYLHILKNTKLICHVEQVFGKCSKTTSDFASCPTTHNVDRLVKFSQSCWTKSAKKLFDGARNFQSNAVLKWNHHVHKETVSIFLGLIGIDESTAKECGAIVLDLLVRAGILVEEVDTSWILDNNYKMRRIYIFGDAKTVENMNKFVRDIQNRDLSYTDANCQAEIFLEALSCVMECPGDWHAGMAMLQSIFNLYYDCLIEPIQREIGWKRINSDVRGCYFQASRLVSMIADELSRLLLHEYVLNHHVFVNERITKDVNEMYTFAEDFGKYIASLRTSTDEFQRSCVHFLEMTFDFLSFVEAYYHSGAVAIEYGYQKHAPVWEMLGQNKYVEIYLKQQENLLRDFTYQRLEELQRNRCVGQFVGNGAHAVVHDEFLEHGNRFFSMFPVPSSLEGFVFQIQFVGLALRCKAFVERWYTYRVLKDVKKKKAYNESVEPSMIPEQKLVYKVLLLCSAHLAIQNQSIHSNIICSISNKITIKVKLDDLDNRMNKARPTSADGFISTLDQLQNPHQKQVPEELEEIPDTEEIIDEDKMLSITREEEDNPVLSLPKKLLHKYVVSNLWKEGWKKLHEKDIVAVCKSKK